MQNRIAILYDFDYTLCKGYAQEYGLMQDFGYNNVIDFFRSNDEMNNDSNMDMCLSLMAGILVQAKNKNIEITKDTLKKYGKNVLYYDGVCEWFDKINKIGESLGYEIEHYIVSSGIKEIIEGCSIADKFKRIYACFYAYKNGKPYWPSQIVNYTSKTQYIYRVRKNALDDLSSLKKINQKMSEEELLPFKNIIYLGDSETDIPSFKVVKNSGGLSICVYDGNNEQAKNVAHKCFFEGRVNYFTPADYREGSDLYNLIVDYIKNIAK